jgi:hypothetical protein
MKKRFWLSFDLGIDGGYGDFHGWLDTIAAKECGSTLSTFELEIGKREPKAAILSAIRRFGIRLRSKDRLYLIWLEHKKVRGEFIAGKRYRPPWAGSAPQSSRDTSEDSEDV